MVNFTWQNVSYVLQNAHHNDMYLSADGDLNTIIGESISATGHWYFIWNSGGGEGKGGNWTIIHAESCKTLIVPLQIGGYEVFDMWDKNGHIQIAVHGTYLNLAFISPLAGTRASFATLAMLATVDQMLWNLIPSLIQQSSQCPQLAGIISDS